MEKAYSESINNDYNKKIVDRYNLQLNLSSAESSLLYEYKVSLSTSKQICMILILEEGK